MHLKYDIVCLSSLLQIRVLFPCEPHMLYSYIPSIPMLILSRYFVLSYLIMIVFSISCASMIQVTIKACETYSDPVFNIHNLPFSQLFHKCITNFWYQSHLELASGSLPGGICAQLNRPQSNS